METGTHKNTIMEDELDCDGDLNIQVMDGDWLTKPMAIDVIKHLSKLFEIGEILEAVEKYEEKQQPPMRSCECKICKETFFIPVDQQTHILGVTCSENCEEAYQELRREGHWR